MEIFLILHREREGLFDSRALKPSGQPRELALSGLLEHRALSPFRTRAQAPFPLRCRAQVPFPLRCRAQEPAPGESEMGVRLVGRSSMALDPLPGIPM